jgi:hypothetical protein
MVKKMCGNTILSTTAAGAFIGAKEGPYASALPYGGLINLVSGHGFQGGLGNSY